MKSKVMPIDEALSVVKDGTRFVLGGFIDARSHTDKRGRLGMAAMGIGIAEASFEKAIAHANQRKACMKRELGEAYGIEASVVIF